jgi:hypothetical protein
MHKYFVVLMSVVLLVVCGCKSNNPPVTGADTATVAKCSGLYFTPDYGKTCKAWNEHANLLATIVVTASNRGSILVEGACSVTCDDADFIP